MQKLQQEKEDNQTWWKTLHGSFADEYWRATITEVETLEAMNAWKVFDHTEDMNVLQSIWAFKLEHFFDGLIKSSKPSYVPWEISRSKALISLKQMLLLFNGQEFV